MESEKEFFILYVQIENLSQTRIVDVGYVWNNSKLIDEYKNVYDVKSNFSHYDKVQGHTTKERLNPGEKINNIILFEKPLNISNTFHFSCDPNFTYKTVDGSVEVSAKKIYFKFFRKDIGKEFSVSGTEK